LVPTWDGNSETTVTWVTEVENFARFSPQAAVELGVVAPTRFTGHLSMTWNLLSNSTRTAISASWHMLSQWIITSYLGNHWQVNEVARFESMKFQQVGHRSETPYDYILRRLFHCCMVTNLTPNSQEELITIMKNSPPEWLPYVPWMDAPNIELLLERLIQHNTHLTEEWEAKHGARFHRRDQDLSCRECRQPSSPRDECSAHQVQVYELVPCEAHQVQVYEQGANEEEREEPETRKDEVEATVMKSDSFPSRSSNRPVPTSSMARTS
jgi:hypothetical protein